MEEINEASELEESNQKPNFKKFALKYKTLVALLFVFFLVLSVLFTFIVINKNDEASTDSPMLEDQQANQSSIIPTESVTSYENYFAKCSKEAPALEKPSQYNVHVMRSAVCMPDISLEKIHIIALAYWPRDIEPSIENVDSQIEGALVKVEEFWEKEFENKSEVTSEFLPILIQGSQNTNDLDYNIIHKDVEDFLNKESETSKIKMIKDLYARDKTKQYLPDSGEFLVVVELIMQDSPNGKTFKLVSSSVIGIAGVAQEIGYVRQWPEVPIENLIAHEVGHTYGLPDMYETPNASFPNEWFDSDPKNIMGGSINYASLEEMHLSSRVKPYILKY